MQNLTELLYWITHHVSPFAIGFGLLAIGAMLLYFLTKWKEFMMIGLTAGIYVIPFLMSPPAHY